VEPTEKFRRADIASGHRWQLGFHFRLHFHVGDMLDLKGPLGGVGGKIFPHRRVNVSRPRAMTLDEVRVVAVHRAHQIRHLFAGGGMERTAEPFGSAYQRQSQARRLTVTLARQERFHVRWVIVQCLNGCLSGHLCRYYCRSNRAYTTPLYKLCIKICSITGQDTADIVADLFRSVVK
jgi:hypothetical protein